MSSGAEVVHVAYATLETLYFHARTAADGLEECSQLSELEFSPNDAVTDAYRGYLGEWSKHRESLQQGLNATAQACKAILDSFKNIEVELISKLTSEGTGKD